MVAIFIVWSHLIGIGGPSIIFVKDIDGYQKLSPGLKWFETIMHSWIHFPCIYSARNLLFLYFGDSVIENFETQIACYFWYLWYQFCVAWLFMTIEWAIDFMTTNKKKWITIGLYLCLLTTLCWQLIEQNVKIGGTIFRHTIICYTIIWENIQRFTLQLYFSLPGQLRCGIHSNRY